MVNTTVGARTAALSIAILLLGAGARLVADDVVISRAGDERPKVVRHGRAEIDRARLDCTLCHAEPGEGASGASSAVSSLAGAAPYSSPTMDATFVGFSRTTRACLGCHDGVIAPDAGGGPAIGVNGLGGEHPIGFAYDAALVARDRYLRDPASAPSGLGGSIRHDLLEDGTLQCTSCHVFHSESTREPALLRVSNRGSALCLTCHDK